MAINKKPLIALGILAAIAGVYAYVNWRKKKKDAENQNQPSAQDASDKTIDSNIGTPTQSAATTIPNKSTSAATPKISAKPTNIVPSSLKDVKDFQDWLDFSGLKWVGATNDNLTNGRMLNKGLGYGNYGSSTKKAWARYGSQYLNRYSQSIKNNAYQAAIDNSPIY